MRRTGGHIARGPRRVNRRLPSRPKVQSRNALTAPSLIEQLPCWRAEMKHDLVKIALALALASCGGTDHAANRGDSAVDHATLTKFDLTSSAFQPNGAIPVQYSCDGAGQSPALSWGEPPAGTGSFALVVD